MPVIGNRRATGSPATRGGSMQPVGNLPLFFVSIDI